MKIGVIGSGIVGQVLAKAFFAEGHNVMLGTRDVSKPEVVKFHTDNPNISTGTFEDTAEFGEVIVLATKGNATEEAISLA